MSKSKRLLLAVLAFGVVVVAGVVAFQTWRSGEPEVASGPATFRRLSEAQYVRTIEDIFGEGVSISGRFDPPWRDAGLLSIGGGKVVVSSSGLAQHELRARDIAAQVLAEDRREKVLTCTPQSADTFDEPCATQFVEKYGRLLYRRPLDQDEIASVLGVASDATQQTGSFYQGLEFGLARLLVSPNFIFRVELTEPDPDGQGTRLDAYSLATRISFLLWNASPDEELLDAAASGALRQDRVLEKQVDRLINSPRFEDGVRAFFSDMFAYEKFVGLTKDQSLYPVYTSQLAKDAQEQLLRTIVNLTVTSQGDYRDLFTTRKTFLNRNLGALYGIPVDAEAVSGWSPHTFAADDPRAGILSLAGFLMLDPSHEGRSSPTIRGKAVRELFLCQTVPPPPETVDFALIEDTQNAEHKTARERLTVHSTHPTCAGCHAITDPIGLALENYNAIGEYRTTENGVTIDTSGSFEGEPYDNAIELQQLIRASPAAPRCVARRVYEYGVGRSAIGAERPWLEYLGERFAGEEYAIPKLMRIVATSNAFQAASVAKDTVQAKTASERTGEDHG